MIKEAFLVCHHIQNPGKFGYDEAHDLASRVMELKLCIASISKLKKQYGIKVGDEQAFDRILRSLLYTVKLVTQMKE